MVARPDTGHPVGRFFAAVHSVVEGEDARWALGEARYKAEAYASGLQTKRGIERDELRVGLGKRSGVGRYNG